MLSATRKTTIQHSIASCSYQQSYATAASVAAAQNSGQSRVRNVRHPPAAPNWRPSAPTLSSHPSSSTLASRLTTLKSSPSQNPANRGTRVKALTPFETSQRVAELLLKDNGFDRAVHMVENLPLDAQDVVVWNMLIAEAMTLRKFNRAFELYYDMKRSHIKPSTRTFITIMLGLGKINDWSKHTHLLQKAHSSYEQLLSHYATLNRNKSNHPDILAWPINAYLRVLGKAKNYQKLWDVYFGMAKNAFVEPDEDTFLAMLETIWERKSLQEVRTKAERLQAEVSTSIREWEMEFGEKERMEVVPTSPTSSSLNAQGASLDMSIDQEDMGDSNNQIPAAKVVHYKNASDAQVIWNALFERNQLPKSSSSRLSVKSSHVFYMLRVMSLGRPTDQKVGFEVIQTYVPALSGTSVKDLIGTSLTMDTSTAKDNKTKATSAIDQIELDWAILQAALELCLQSARYPLAIEFFETIASDPNLKSIIDNKHMIEILRAYAHVIAAHGKLTDGRSALAALEWMIREALPPKNNARCKPKTAHCHYVLQACSAGGDFVSALRVFEMVSGIRREEFFDPDQLSQENNPEQGSPYDHRSDIISNAFTKRLHWDRKSMNFLLKTALASNSTRNQRIALRIFHHYPPSHFFESLADQSEQPEMEDLLSEVHKHKMEWRSEFCDRLLRTARNVLRASSKDDPQRRIWVSIEQLALDEKDRIKADYEKIEQAKVELQERTASAIERNSVDEIIKEELDGQRLVFVSGEKRRWNE